MDNKEFQEAWREKVAHTDRRALIEARKERNRQMLPRVRQIKQRSEELLHKSQTLFGVPASSDENRRNVQHSPLIPLGKMDISDNEGVSYGFATISVEYAFEGVARSSKLWLGRLSTDISHIPRVTDKVEEIAVRFQVGREDGSMLVPVVYHATNPGTYANEAKVKEFETSLDFVAEALSKTERIK